MTIEEELEEEEADEDDDAVCSLYSWSFFWNLHTQKKIFIGESDAGRRMKRKRPDDSYHHLLKVAHSQLFLSPLSSFGKGALNLGRFIQQTEFHVRSCVCMLFVFFSSFYFHLTLNSQTSGNDGLA
jgi:hypothetical protein